MLIERRAYTFRPGGIADFLDAQSMLGFDPVTRPIMARLMAYFIDSTSRGDQIVHYWRFDSYDDWMARLHRKDPSREPYFRRVRPLMLEQENRFMLPAPIPALTPVWGNAHDWLPGSPPLEDLADYPALIIEETTFHLAPGGLPALWDGLRSCDLRSGVPLTERLIACFYTLVGRQHEVVMLRWHGDVAAGQEHAGRLAEDRSWQTFLAGVAPLLLDSSTRSMTLPALAPMCPLFRYPPGNP